MVQEALLLRKELILQKTANKNFEVENTELKRMVFMLTKKYQNAKEKKHEFEGFYRKYKGNAHQIETSKNITANA